MTVVTIIPARGGSKGIPRKNLCLLGGKPLLAYSIESALASQLVDSVYVSTDDPEIKDIASNFGAQIIQRPEHLADDLATSESALLHALSVLEDHGLEVELIVFLQATSPLRDNQDIDNAINQLRSDEADSLLSVSPSHCFLWQMNADSPTAINYDYKKRQRRQDIDQQYRENGSIYIFKPWVLKKFENRLGGKLSLYIMPDERSWDIDTLEDLNYVRFLLENQKIG